jgi:ketosteroid isomerase-like protein
VKRTLWMLAIGVFVAVGGTAVADANSDAKKAIQSINDQAMTLILKQDYKSLAKLCTPDCKFTQSGQTMSLDQMIAIMKPQMAQMKNVKMTSTVLTCSVNGKTATCTNHDKSSASIMGADKKTHKMTSDGTSRSVYVKSGNTWLMKSNSTIVSKDMVDGKPFNPGSMMGGGSGSTKK